MKLILIIIFTSMIFSEKVKEPKYKVIKKEGDIEIREYGTYVVAKTSISKDSNSDNNMFRTLASYIFGGNKKNESIPMTAPVTTFSDVSIYLKVLSVIASVDSVTACIISFSSSSLAP